jgi:hypothetical protein
MYSSLGIAYRTCISVRLFVCSLKGHLSRVVLPLHMSYNRLGIMHVKNFFILYYLIPIPQVLHWCLIYCWLPDYMTQWIMFSVFVVFMWWSRLSNLKYIPLTTAWPSILFWYLPVLCSLSCGLVFWLLIQCLTLTSWPVLHVCFWPQDYKTCLRLKST